MFTFAQREKLRAAFLVRSFDAPVRKAGPLRRMAREGRIFDKMLERKAAEFKRVRPSASDGEIFKMILDWIANGGLETLLSFITKIISLFP